MALDADKIRFGGKLITAAHALGASINSEDGAAFEAALYDEWRASGQPLEMCAGWLQQRLSNCFQSLSAPPVWVEDEPNWQFHDGKPMVFISQVSFGDTEVSRSSLSIGETVYLFGCRVQDGRGFRMIYKTTSQFSSLRSQ